MSSKHPHRLVRSPNQAFHPASLSPLRAVRVTGEFRRWARHKLKTNRVIAAVSGALLLAGLSYGAEPEMRDFRGVVTYHLIPAKVMKVNEIVEDPEPGTSYIGEEGILVEYEKDVDVRANWTVVEIGYYQYEEPKNIKYELFGEEREMTVNYHAERVVVDGDISDYIEK